MNRSLSEPPEIVGYAFTDRPVRIIWILRDGQTVLEQVVNPPQLTAVADPSPDAPRS